MATIGDRTTVRSADGTKIVYARRGTGPAVILITGALDDGSENDPVAEELSGAFTSYNYNRRGRGDSGDTAPYSVQREIEDIAALIEIAGGRAHLYGVSSGGGLALEATAAGLPVDRVAIYEVPYLVGDELGPIATQYVEQLTSALDQDRRGDALELFMQLAGSPPEQIDQARESPYWPGLLDLAPTLAYDAACCRGYRPTEAFLGTVDRPVLVATGGGVDLFEAGADLVAAAVPDSTRTVLTGQGHVVQPDRMAPVLTDFFAG